MQNLTRDQKITYLKRVIVTPAVYPRFQKTARIGVYLYMYMYVMYFLVCVNEHRADYTTGIIYRVAKIFFGVGPTGTRPERQRRLPRPSDRA